MAYSTTRSTFFCPAGTKWYWEFVPTTGYNYASCGITTNSAGWAVNPGGTTDGHGVGFYGTELDVDGTRNMSAITAWASGDIVSFAYDVDNDEIKYYINGSLSYTYSSVPTSTDGPYSPTFGDFGGSVAATINVNFGQDSSFAGLKTAQGNQDDNGVGDFYYDVPAGYLALCTDNLSDPEIALPGENFNTVLYTGDGSAEAVTGVGFQPDLVWVKTRNYAENHKLFDAVRGLGSLRSNTNSAENTDTNENLTSYDSDGFTIKDPDYIVADRTIVGWNWKGDGVAGGTLNEDGDTDSYVNVNTAAGFSIVKVTFPDALDHTFGHGLSKAPELVIGKDVEASALWWVYSKPSGNTKYLELNTNAAASDAYEAWQDTTPSASVVYVTGGVYVTDEEFINYCFHSVEGYSKVSTYEGNGVDNGGPFVYTGFEPAVTIIKSIDQAREWWIMDNKRDPYNDNGVQVLWPDTNDAEGDNYTNYDLDYLSNGFKVMGDNNKVNESGQTYLFYSVAASPFKTSNAR